MEVGFPTSILFVGSLQSGLRTSGDQSLAGGVALVLDEILDESLGEVFRLLVPLGGILVGVARIQDFRVDSRQGSGDFEIEVRQLLGRGLQDFAIEDGVDDATGILDGDALAGAVPAGVDQIGLGVVLLHLLDQLLGVLGRVQFEERLAEACGEGRSRLGDAALGSSQLGGEAGEEVVLGLLRGQDADRRQDRG